MMIELGLLTIIEAVMESAYSDMLSLITATFMKTYSNFSIICSGYHA